MAKRDSTQAVLGGPLHAKTKVGITVGPVDKTSVLPETLSRSRVLSTTGTTVFVRLFMLGFARTLTAAEADVKVSVIVSVTMRPSV